MKTDETSQPKPTRKKRMFWWIILLVVAVPFLIPALLNLGASRPQNLGVNDGLLSPCPDSPNCVCTQDDSPEHQMKPIPFTDSPDDALERIKAAIQSLPRTALISESKTYLHFEVRSLIYRYVDDVEIYIDAPQKLIHFRSASRVGKSDMGVNRARMDELVTLLNGSD